MRTSALTRLLVIASLSASTLLCAQSHPSSPPDGVTLPSSALIALEAPLTPEQAPPRPAKVSYTSGQLTVSASNSSLDQILRDIARLTKIRITGGVADQRVFGTYGPASANEILSTLLEGTGTNMLLVQGASGLPSELILTPRMGGPTPPKPNAVAAGENPRRFANTNLPPQSQPTPAPTNAAPQPIPPPPSANPSPDSNQQLSPSDELRLRQLQQRQQQQQRPQ